MRLTKRQRIRVRRMLNNFRGPLNHMSRDGIDKIFDAELDEMKDLAQKIRIKAMKMGYDPEEELGLTDVGRPGFESQRASK